MVTLVYLQLIVLTQFDRNLSNPEFSQSGSISSINRKCFFHRPNLLLSNQNPFFHLTKFHLSILTVISAGFTLTNSMNEHETHFIKYNLNGIYRLINFISQTNVKLISNLYSCLPSYSSVVPYPKPSLPVTRKARNPWLLNIKWSMSSGQPALQNVWPKSPLLAQRPAVAIT